MRHRECLRAVGYDPDLRLTTKEFAATPLALSSAPRRAVADWAASLAVPRGWIYDETCSYQIAFAAAALTIAGSAVAARLDG